MASEPTKSSTSATSEAGGRDVAAALARLALVTWAGGLWIVGYLAAPALFAGAPDRMLAGALAGRMFAALGWLGLACGGYLLVHYLKRGGWRTLRARLVALMLVLHLAVPFGAQPVIAGIKAEAVASVAAVEARAARFALWHALAAALHGAASLTALILVARRATWV